MTSDRLDPEEAGRDPAATSDARADHVPPTERAPGRRRPARRLSLALQGGGSFGAFTWGVLDRLLEQEGLIFDTISGASAGAVNAVLLADGLAAGGPAAAREKLERFWRRVSQAAPVMPLGLSRQSATAAAFELSAHFASPYHFNPLGLNPLRELLVEMVDFARLRAASPVRLLIAATRVKDGRLRLFREGELTVDALLASACLPFLQHAVEIDGEAYWDGGYSANPPLRQLAIDTRADDVVLVEIIPAEQAAVPQLSPEIARRLREIAFSVSLQKELEALADLRAMCKDTWPPRSRLCRKLERLRLHRVAAADHVKDLRQESPLDAGWPLISRLHGAGRAAAGAWLTANQAGATKRSSQWMS